MGLRDKLPNKALSGAEVREIALQEFAAMLDSNYAFLPTVAYKRVAFTLSAVFHFGTPHPDHTLNSRVRESHDGVITGEAPLSPDPEGKEDQAVVGIERDVNLENPNLDRIAHGMPIRIQKAVPPKPIIEEHTLPGEPQVAGMMTESFENVEYRFDKEDYPEPQEPVQRDTSESAADKLGVPARRSAMGLKQP